LISGEKTFLRPVTQADLHVVHGWENDPEFWNVSETPGPFSEQEILDFIATAGNLEKYGQLRLVILDDKQNLVGELDLFNYDQASRSAGVGIMIANENERKKGYAADALTATIQHYQKEKSIALLHCLIYNDNIASISLFRKCGFEKQGHKIFKGKDAIQFIRHL